ncbi:hypothetical protein BELL_0762g00030 [Botrytis elliptica]|uniref:Uncharacterized protein n=1 Tax=Botrytis elliptica TaxID=278938 RepID=A0A4Z1JDZ1_9HELO|nr:hypothetical protein BELL_0762g00030 [Botrytis elliptica]
MVRQRSYVLRENTAQSSNLDGRLLLCSAPVLFTSRSIRKRCEFFSGCWRIDCKDESCGAPNFPGVLEVANERKKTAKTEQRRWREIRGKDQQNVQFYSEVKDAVSRAIKILEEDIKNCDIERLMTFTTRVALEVSHR